MSPGASFNMQRLSVSNDIAGLQRQITKDVRGPEFGKVLEVLAR
jgi:hypothetical protein